MARKKRKKIKDIINDAKASLQSAGEDVKFAPLLAFKPLMIRELDRRGIKHGKSLHEISKLFLDEIIKKSNGKHFETVNGFNLEGEHLYAEAAESIVSMILAFFKKLKDKKERGEAMTEEELKVLNGAQEVTDTIVNAGKDSAQLTVAEKVRDFIFSWKGGLTLVAVGVLLYMAFKK